MIGFDAAVFDLDGTLLDSLGMWESLDVVFLKKRGIAAPLDYPAAVGTMAFRQAAEYTVRRFGLAETPEELIREWDSLAAGAYENTIPLKPGAKEFLLSLKAAGKKMGVATALPPRLYGPALVRNGVWGLFDAFASVEEVGRSKDFPDIYLLAAEKLRVPPCRCVAFEDMLPGVLGAKAAGMAAVGVYDPASRSDEARMRAAADGYLKTWPAEGFAGFFEKGRRPAEEKKGRLAQGGSR